MSHTVLDVHGVVNESAADDNLAHIFCCVNSDVGLCGAPLEGWAEADDMDCVVCHDLEENAPWGHCPLGTRCVKEPEDD